MTKKDLINAVQAEYGDLTKKKVGEVLGATFDAIARALKDEGRFAVPGFGVLTVKTRASRTGRNPRSGDSIEIPESKTVGFKLAPDFRNSLNG
ncbi:MAG: HU family DNA-binding protein [Myxococcales bacterium]|nr:HU family DNA-binding protein [Myxococcales bacterium]MCB9548848.1 HU family DNA-binding protein [Myxococcales bacterium]